MGLALDRNLYQTDAGRQALADAARILFPAVSEPGTEQLAEAWLHLTRTTKTALADQVGVHFSYIGKIFRGQKRPGDDVRAKLVDAGVPAYLLGDQPKGESHVDGQKSQAA